MISVQTNVSSLINGNSMFTAENSMKKISERLSSGLRVNRAADDPSGLAISEGMKAHIRGITSALQNLQDFMGYLENRDMAMQEQMECAIKIRDLCVRAANDATLTSSDMAKLNDEAQGYAKVITHIGETASLRETVEPGTGVPTLFGPGEIDVVWVLDQTGSMDDHLNKLATVGAAQMFNALTSRRFDVRMAAMGFGELADIPNHDVDGDGPDVGSGIGFGNTLTFTGVFQSTAAGFAADVTTIANQAGLGTERGLSAIWDASDNFGLAPSATATNTQFRQDAQKIFILITDEDSDDAGRDEQTDAAPQGADSFVIPTSYKTDLQTKLQTLYGTGVQVWSACNLERTAAPAPNAGSLNTDSDYTDFVAMMGGQSVQLDTDPNGGLPGGNPTTTWIDTITNSLTAFGGPYELKVQYGPDYADNETITFKTVTSTTAGLSVSLTSAASARSSIDTAEAGIQFIANEMEFTGELERRVSALINEYTNELINTRGACSTIVDADMADHASQMAKQQIILNAAQSISIQANAQPSVAVDLLATQGIGQDNALLQTGL